MKCGNIVGVEMKKIGFVLRRRAQGLGGKSSQRPGAFAREAWRQQGQKQKAFGPRQPDIKQALLFGERLPFIFVARFRVVQIQYMPETSGPAQGVKVGFPAGTEGGQKNHREFQPLA